MNSHKKGGSGVSASSIGIIIGRAAIIIVALLFVFIMTQSHPEQKQPQSLPSSTHAYPPPSESQILTTTSVPYPPPNPTAGLPTKTVRPTIAHTPGSIPPPTGWPTNLPWPPTPQATVPMPTRVPTLYPTPIFPATPQGKPPAGLSQLWYVFAPDSKSRPILQSELIDSSSAQRWGKGQTVADIKLEQADPGPSIIGLYPSPDRKKLIASVNFDVHATLFLVTLEDGKARPLLPTGNSSQFLGWTYDSQKVIVKGMAPAWQAAEVDITSGKLTVLEFTKLRGDSLTVYALAYSPDGKYLADALVYPPSPKEGKESLLNIGLWDTRTWERKTIQDIPFGSSVSDNSLAWFGDGQWLTWMAIKRANANPFTNKIQSELWVYDLSTGVAKVVRLYEGSIGNGAVAVWSLDGKKLAVVLWDENNGNNLSGNIYLIDLASGADIKVSHFKQRNVNYLQFSPDGQWIYCHVADKISGAIYAVNVSQGDAIPVAGPVPAYSPFLLVP